MNNSVKQYLDYLNRNHGAYVVHVKYLDGKGKISNHEIHYNTRDKTNMDFRMIKNKDYEESIIKKYMANIFSDLIANKDQKSVIMKNIMIGDDGIIKEDR